MPTGVWEHHVRGRGHCPRCTGCDGFALGLTYSEGTLEGNLVLLDVVDGVLGDSGLAILDDGSDVDRLPGNGGLEVAGVSTGLLFLSWTARVVMTYLGGGKDVLDGLGDLGADTVAFDQADKKVALRIMLADCQL